MKNVLPYDESDMENGASVYSNPWNNENTTPNKMVAERDFLEVEKFPLIIEWWAQVTDTPDERSRIVFRSGILIGLNDKMAAGGQA